jgi:WD40 repeat protein
MVKVAIFTPRPPVNLFERVRRNLDTVYIPLIEPDVYAQTDSLGNTQTLRETSATLTDVKLTNTSGATRTVDFRITTATSVSYTADVVALPGANWLRVDRVNRLRGLSLYGYDWTSAPPVRWTETPAIGAIIATGHAWEPGSRYLAVAYQVNYVGIFDRDNDYATVSTIPNPVPAHNVAVAWSADGRYLAVGYNFAALAGVPAVRVFDLLDRTAPVEVPMPNVVPDNARYLSWGGPSGRYLVAASSNGQITVFDWNSGSPVHVPALAATLKAQVPGGVQAVRWSPNGARLAFAHASGDRLTVFDWPAPTTPVKILNTAFAANTRRLPGAGGLAWSANSRYLCCVSGVDTTTPFTVYDLQSGVVVLPPPASLPPLPALTTAAWSPDGSYLCIGHAEATRYQYYPVELPYLLLYDYQSGSPVRITQAPELQGDGYVTQIAWSADGEVLTVSGWSYDRFYPATGVDNVRLVDDLGDNHVVNGSFEDQTGSTRTDFGFTAIGSIPGWYSDGDPGAELFFPEGRFVDAYPTDGSLYLDVSAISSLQPPNNNARLRQDFDTLVAGATYRLSVDVTASLRSDTAVRVLWNGAAVNFTLGQTLPVELVIPLLRIDVPAGETVTVPLTKAIIRYGDILEVQASGGGVVANVSYITVTQEDFDTISTVVAPDPED